MANNIVFGKLDPPPIELVDLFPSGGGGWFTGVWQVLSGLLSAFGHSAVGSVQTTDATEVTLCKLELQEGRGYLVCAEVAVANADLSEAGFYVRYAYATRAAGGNAAVTQESLNADFHAEPDNDCDVNIEATDPASGNIRIAVTGDAAKTYNWRGVLRAIPNRE